MSNLFLARQPIYDQRMRVHGYELLYRSSEINAAGDIDRVQASAQVIINAFLDIGLARLVGPHQAFLNLPQDVLISRRLPLPPDRVTLEVLEDAIVSPELLQALHGFSQAGYPIALDDFIYHPSLEPLVELADVVKIDVLSLDPDALVAHVERLRKHHVKLLAEKVETPEQYDLCQKLGFELFQGYFFCKPKIIKGRVVPSNRMTILRLLTELQDPEAETADLERIVTADVSLSYKLLKLMNSAFYSLPNRIESVRQAVVYLGHRNIKAWASLIALAGIDGKPGELMTLAMVRGKMCEMVAEAVGHARKAPYFTVGLFSVLDALMDAPMDKVLEALPLSERIATALLWHEGSYGEVLRCVLAYERGQWDDEACAMVPDEVLRESYLTAICWADDARQELDLAA